MHALDVLGDPVRRRILDALSREEHSAGELVEVVAAEFGISQPAVSHHLRVLRENGFVSVRAAGARRIYAVQASGLDAATAQIERYRAMWTNGLAALHTEVARGKREARATGNEDR